MKQKQPIDKKLAKDPYQEALEILMSYEEGYIPRDTNDYEM